MSIWIWIAVIAIPLVVVALAGLIRHRRDRARVDRAIDQLLKRPSIARPPDMPRRP